MAIIMKEIATGVVYTYARLLVTHFGVSTHSLLSFCSRCQHELLLSKPKQKHSVKYAELLKAEQGGESGGLTTGFNVLVDDSHLELTFYASSPEDAQVKFEFLNLY